MLRNLTLLVAGAAFCVGTAFAQLPDQTTLNKAYNVRYLGGIIGSSADTAASFQGTLTFDGKGGFTVTAATPDGVVMAIEDEAAGRWAVQFHPESILTAAGRAGHRIIANVLGHVRARAAARG